MGIIKGESGGPWALASQFIIKKKAEKLIISDINNIFNEAVVRRSKCV